MHRSHQWLFCILPRESTVHDTVGVYKSTKCHIVVFWRLKYEMRNYGTRNCGIKPRVQLSFSKKIFEKQKSLSVEMGHSRNSKTYNYKIKVLRAICN